MTVYTDADLKQRPETVLDDAKAQGEVRIKRDNGQEFVLRPAENSRSPLDVPGVKTDLTADEIVRFVREGRERG
jgi:hypothetical protein